MADTRSCWALLLLLVVHEASSEISGQECCDAWTKDGWKRLKEVPVGQVEQRKPTDCANAVLPLMLRPTRNRQRPARPERPRRSDPSGSGHRARRAAQDQLGPGQQHRLSWTPGGPRGHLGVSFCRDREQTSCFMLDAQGLGQGRLGYSWRRHGQEEASLLTWVPGRRDPVPEQLIKSSPPLDEGVWPQNGAKEVQLNLQRTGSMALRIWLTGSEHESVELPLPEDVPFFAVTPHEPYGQINTATAAVAVSQGATLDSDPTLNPLLMRGRNLLVRPGNQVIVSWRPDDAKARLGVAMCRDEQQSYCHVLLLFGIAGRLGYVFKRHSFQEAGAAGWVAGRHDRVPGSVLLSDNSVEGWPQGGRQPLSLVVDRTNPGSVTIWVEGGEALSFQLPDFYSYFTVSSLDDRGGSAIIDGAQAPAVDVAGPDTPDAECVAAARATMLRGQQMLLKWEPRGTRGNVGVSFCVDSSQGDCYVLDLFGFRNHRLGYSWRHHSALQDGPGAWVPGRDTLLPEKHLQADSEVEPGWQDASSVYYILLTLNQAGELELRVDGVDAAQKRQLVFSLPEGHSAIAVASAQNTGEFTTLGPCFNGARYKFSALLCNLPDASGLVVDIAELNAAWTLKARSAHGQVRSPAMSGDDGSVCIGIEALALGSARIVVSLESLDGGASPVRLAEIVPQDTSKGEWQRLQKTATLPAAMRNGQVRIVVTGDQVDGRGLVLIKTIDFCNPHTCGVAPQGVQSLIAYGNNAKVGDYPWYSGIYRQEGDSYESICGGTLVRPDVVVSAAHCFYDESTWKTRDKNRFKVSVGKYSRAWEVTEAGEQRSAVFEIFIPDRYRGSKRIYEQDIAFLRVRFVVSTLVLPVCVDLDGKQSLRGGDIGVVTGWGTTESQSPSTKLQWAKMPFVPFDQCIKSVPDTLAKFITGDKFCAGNINGSTVWPGDSGGGLTFEKSGRWFLRGVVSTGIPNRLTYSAFTDVYKYLQELRRFFQR